MSTWLTLTSLMGALSVNALVPALSHHPARYESIICQNVVNSSNTNSSGAGSRVIPFPGRGNGISGVVNYPYGSRVNTNGAITTPGGQVISPSVTVNHGDGSVTYYYRDGSRINTNGTTIKPIGIPLTR